MTIWQTISWKSALSAVFPTARQWNLWKFPEDKFLRAKSDDLLPIYEENLE